MPNSNPLISVVVPHLNQADRLWLCLKSLRAQSVNPACFEVIVVDNGSDELPAESCESFEGIQLEQEAMPGPGPARNKGVSVARGEILAFIDADCTAHPEWLASISSALDDRANAQILGGDVRIDLCNTNRPTMLEAYEMVFAYRQKEYIERQSFAGTGNLAMHRSVFESVGPFGGIDVAEDREWGRRATRMGYAIQFAPDMVVFHPARASFNQLHAKWDRHVAHDYAEYTRVSFGRMRWAGLILATALSPVVDMRRIIGSRQVSTWAGWTKAGLTLFRIRWYRAFRMLELLFRGKTAASSRWWNRT